MKALAIFRQHTASPDSVAAAETFLKAAMLFIAFEQMQSNFTAVDRLLTGCLGIIRDSMRLLKQKQYESSVSRLKETSSPKDTALLGLLHQKMCVISPMSAFFNDASEEPPSAMAPNANFPHRDDSIEIVFALWRCDMCQTYAFFREALYFRNLAASPGIASVQGRLGDFIAKHARWRAMVEHDLQTETNELRRVSWNVIQLHSKVTIVLLRGILDSTETTYGALTDDFRDVLGGFLDLLLSADDSVKATLISGFLPIICFIACKCRDKEVRTRMLEVFDIVSAAGPWSARLLLKSIRAMIDLEEAHRDETGLVPVSARYAWTDLTWNFQDKQLVSRFNKLVPDENGTQVRTCITTDFSSVTNVT